MTVAPTSSAATGFLYGTGEGGNDEVPVCCTPEFLAAYGVGLDSTFGDGVVSGVLREDQAETAFASMYSDVYSGMPTTELQGLTKQIEDIVMGMSDDGVNVQEVMRQAVVRSQGDTNGEQPNEKNEATVDALAGVLTELSAAIAGSPELESMLGGFFGSATEDINVNGEHRDEMGMSDKLAYIMTRTVVSGYDVTDKNNDSEQVNMDEDLENGNGDRNGNDANISSLDKSQIGKQPRVSLGEIAQWSVETGAFMDLHNELGGGQSVADFTQQLFTAVSSGDAKAMDDIIGASTYTHEQLQVLASVMMNNHASLMATGGSYSTSAKNGAHEYLNNIDGDNDQAFQMLHIGNVGSADATGGEIDDTDNEDGFGAGDSDGNDDLNQTSANIASGDEAAIFNAGDNGQGSNGGFGNALDDEEGKAAIAALGDAFGTAAPTGPAEVGGTFTEDMQAELLPAISDMGAGDPDTIFPDNTEVTLADGTEVNVSIENSEDFENEGYDVVVVTVTDPTTGELIGSMTATEAADPTNESGSKLVEYADANGDGIVDAVDETTGLTAETTDADGDGLVDREANALTYFVQADDTSEEDGTSSGGGMVDWAATGSSEELGGLAMNESEDMATEEWTHDFEDGAASNGLKLYSEEAAQSYGETMGYEYGEDSGATATVEIIVDDATGEEVDPATITMETDPETGSLVLPAGYSYDEIPLEASEIPETSPAGTAVSDAGLEGTDPIPVSMSGNLLIGGMEYDPVTYSLVQETEGGAAGLGTVGTTDGTVDATGGVGDTFDPMALGYTDNGDDTWTDPATGDIYDASGEIITTGIM